MREKNLQELCRRIRYNIITSTTEAGSGHPTSSLSAVELTSVLFFGGFFKQDLTNYKNILNDKFILSKGHAAPLLYSLYEAAGVLTHKEMLTLRKFDSPLQGHPTPQVPFVDVTTGSLGQGLSIGLGMALGIRLKMKELGLTPKQEPTVWVLLGDSEMAEGQVWEAMEIASYYNVNNLVGIVDINRLGQSGETDLAWDIETYKKRIETFGWHVIEIKNGHNIEEIQKTFIKANTLNTVRTQKPIMILARTIKGKGIPFLEDKQGWHGKPVPKERLQEALDAIGPYDKKIKGIITSPPAVDLELYQKTKNILKRLDFVIGGVAGGAPRHARIPALRESTGGEEGRGRIYDKTNKVATREAFGDALSDLGVSNKQVVALDAEVGNSTYTERLKKTNPSHFFQMFIDEENMVSVGLGISKIEYIPFISTFAAFFSRAFDQIRMAQYSVSANSTNLTNSTLNIVGSHAGCSIGSDGASQMGLEDISMMRSIRNSTVLYPADGPSTYQLTKSLSTRSGINYLRTTREKTPVLYDEKEEFPIGGCKVHNCHPPGADPVKKSPFKTLIIAAGITLHEALKAQKILGKKKIYTTVVDLYSIKPLDSKTLLELAKKTKHIIVVEDHYEAGGIGEAVLTSLSDSRVQSLESPRFTHLCVRKEPRSGTPEELLRYEEIDAEAIINSLLFK
jgi:transketolase